MTGEDLILECQLCHERFYLPRCYDEMWEKEDHRHLFGGSYLLGHCGGIIKPLVFIR
jgi:hypothetical protein